MQDETISGLGAANLPLTGTELIVLVQDGVTKKTSLDNLPEQLDSNELEAVQNANAPTGANPFATIADLGISGTWTPTISGFNSGINGAIIDNAKYSRTGNVVTCTIDGNINLDFSSVNFGSFDFTLPIASESYPTTGCASIEISNQCNGLIKSGGRFFLSSADTSFVGFGVPFYAIFQYEIL